MSLHLPALHVRRVRRVRAVVKKKRVSLPVLTDILDNVDRLTLQIGDGAARHAYGKFGATCSAACNGCCYQKFDVSFGEGLALARWLIDQGRADDALDWELRKAAVKMTGASHREHMLAKIPCVFLVDGKCSVYEARPLLCRTVFVRSDPAWCHPDSKGEHEVELMDQAPWGAMAAKVWEIVERELHVQRGWRESLPAMVRRGIEYLRRCR